MSTKRDYYEILGASKSATEAELKSAYRKMALQWHPDKHPDKKEQAETKFKEINEAYQVLSDKQKRQAYDQFGHSAFEGASGMGGNPFAGGQRSGPFTWSYSSGGGNPFGGFADDAGYGDPFDIFEQFFGGSFRGQAQQRRPRYTLTIDFMDAVKGAEKVVKVDGKEKKIKIPAGANEGTRIQFEDFEITLDVRPDSKFTREGYDLFIDEEVSFVQAALGGDIEVPTINKPIKMKVRAGTQPNTLVRLKGEGVPFLRGSGKGDLYVRLKVSVPEKLSHKQKQLLKEFEKAN